MFDFRHRIALVTGGGSGIGRATCLAFARAGARVVIADVDETGAEATATRLFEEGGEAIIALTDVTIEKEITALIDRTMSAYGRIDCVFNNAGIEGQSGKTAECTLENWQRVINTNLTGVWQCMRHEIPPMLKQGGGSIVNCASIAGLVGFPDLPAYTASKHAVIGLTRSAALEYAPMKLRINAVCPGVIHTPMLERAMRGLPQAEAAFSAQTPIGRIGLPEEIANAVLWLSCDDASYVTGHALAVDGGWVAR